MNILISGASGFMGSNLVAYLAAQQPSVTIKRLGREHADLSWENLSDESLSGIDAIIHLAGKAHDTSNSAEASEYFKVNYELTRKLYDHFLNSNAHTFIYMSSVKAAADTVNGVLTEEATPDPRTPYGQSKLQAEQYLLQHIPEGRNVYILRPCMVHGPGNKGNLNLLYKVACKGVPWPLAAFTNKRSFLSIDNLCFVVQRLLSENISPGVYHLADDEPLSTNTLIDIMAVADGRKANLWKIPASIIRMLARCGDVLKLPINSERLKKLTESYVVSNQKIKNALHLERLPVSAREGLTITIKSFRQAN